jgi:signal transduction histidine kinase
MDRQAAAKKNISNYLIPLTIFCILFIYLRYHYVNSRNEINEEITELAGLLVEPLWNADTQIVANFVSVLIAREEYLQIQIFGPDELPMAESLSKHLDGLDEFFSKINLLKTKEISSSIDKDGEKLGKITVNWKDTAIYYYVNASLFAILLYIITLLYGSMTKANRTLKENNADLHKALEEVKKQRDYIERIFNVIPEGLVTFDKQRNPVIWNSSFEQISQIWAERLNKDMQHLHTIFFKRLFKEIEQKDEGEFAMDIESNSLSISFKSLSVSGFENIDRIISLYDVSEMASMRMRLSQAEKLESVGRLAAGIAHEINTPTQYVITNIDFLSEAFEDVITLLDKVENLFEENLPEFVARFNEIIEDADWEYLKGEIPAALNQSSEGSHRIKTIVSAMKTFSHPSGAIAEMCDLNQAIESTVTVTGNEWKYVADLELDLASDLPLVPCFLDQFNQVVLNMIINSVHAIEENLMRTGETRGKIKISSRSVGHCFELAIADNGIGMSNEVKRKLFEPFFTTKAVNKGTGQGLAIANDIIVNKHKGAIKITSKEGKGTTFRIQLPYDRKNTIPG